MAVICPTKIKRILKINELAEMVADYRSLQPYLFQYLPM
jgi:hypothetical protein